MLNDVSAALDTPLGRTTELGMLSASLSNTSIDNIHADSILFFSGIKTLHKLELGNFGRDDKAVLLSPDKTRIILNLDFFDRYPAKFNQSTNQNAPNIPNSFYVDIAHTLHYAFCLNSLVSASNSPAIRNHPVVKSAEEPRLAGALKLIAHFIPSSREFVASILASEKIQEESLVSGIFKKLFSRKPPAEFRILNEQEFSMREKDLRALSPEYSIGRYLMRYVQSFSGYCPTAPMSISFLSKLEDSLQQAIIATCRELKLPDYKGDVWDALNTNHRDKRIPLLIKKHWNIDDYNVPLWVTESQSGFNRNDHIFGKIAERVRTIGKQAKAEGSVQHLRFGVVGVGMNEDAIGLSIMLQGLLSAEGLRPNITYSITVLSRANPTMKALEQHLQEHHPYPITYGDRGFHWMGDAWKAFFEKVSNGWQPNAQTLAPITYQSVDISEPNLAGRIEGFQFLMAQNVHHYLSQSGRVVATANYEQLCREGTNRWSGSS